MNLKKRKLYTVFAHSIAYHNINIIYIGTIQTQYKKCDWDSYHGSITLMRTLQDHLLQPHFLYKLFC